MSNYTDLVNKFGKETSRAACKKCGYAGHLTFQCRNFIKVHYTLFELGFVVINHTRLINDLVCAPYN